MNKITNNSAHSAHGELSSAYTGQVWLKENEELVEKLEAAYEAVPGKNAANHNKQFYGIKFNTLHLLIDKNISSELLEDSSIYPVPLAADWLIGVANIRGDIVPVIDFEKMITGESANQNTNNSKIIIINKGMDAIGLMLDQLPKLISFSSDAKLSDYSSLPEVIQEYVEYAYTQDAITWACVDFPAFIQSNKI